MINTKNCNNSSSVNLFSSNAISWTLSVNLLLSALLVNFTVPNKQFFSEILIVALGGQVFNYIYTMYKFKIKLLYNEETLPLAKWNMIGSKLVPNGLIFSDDTPVDIQLVNFFCYLILGNWALGQKLENSNNHHFLQNTFYLTKNHTYTFSHICATLFVAQILHQSF